MRPKALVIHHSAGEWGDVEWLDWLHRHRRPPFSMVGYHKVILNGVPTYEDFRRGNYRRALDGKIQQGRADNQRGAHCLGGWNSKSLGICLIGHLSAHEPTARQWASLVDACARLALRYGLRETDIYGHRELWATACPGDHLDLDLLRCEVAPRIRRGN